MPRAVTLLMKFSSYFLNYCVNSNVQLELIMGLASGSEVNEKQLLMKLQILPFLWLDVLSVCEINLCGRCDPLFVRISVSVETDWFVVIGLMVSRDDVCSSNMVLYFHLQFSKVNEQFCYCSYCCSAFVLLFTCLVLHSD